MTGPTAGERWAHDELERLRAAAFAPAAVGGFLRASWERASDTRAARPDLARQAWTWSAAGAAAWCGLAAAGCEPFRRRARSGLVWWGGVALMLDWHLGLVETEDGRPRPLGAADALTLSRAWLVPVLADDVVPAAVLAAALSDVLDGVASRAAEPTRAGRDLEGLVDGLVFLAALDAARRRRLVSRPVLAVESVRLIAGLTYATGHYFARSGSADPRVVHAARVAAPLRMAGLLAAGLRRRRAADALLLAGSATGIALLILHGS